MGLGDTNPAPVTHAGMEVRQSQVWDPRRGGEVDADSAAACPAQLRRRQCAKSEAIFMEN